MLIRTPLRVIQTLKDFFEMGLIDKSVWLSDTLLTRAYLPLAFFINIEKIDF